VRLLVDFADRAFTLPVMALERESKAAEKDEAASRRPRGPDQSAADAGARVVRREYLGQDFSLADVAFAPALLMLPQVGITIDPHFQRCRLESAAASTPEYRQGRQVGRLTRAIRGELRCDAPRTSTSANGSSCRRSSAASSSRRSVLAKPLPAHRPPVRCGARHQRLGDAPVPGAVSRLRQQVSRQPSPHSQGRRVGALYGMLPLRHGVSGALHPHRGRRASRSTVEKFPMRYEIDTLRCIYCGCAWRRVPVMRFAWTPGCIRASSAMTARISSRTRACS